MTTVSMINLFAGELDIELPSPVIDGGLPLMKTLSLRSSTRDFSDQQLDNQQLSNLLWAAFGINREESDKRTAPSAMNWQEISIYVAIESGLYRYDAQNNILIHVLSEDVRKMTGKQSFVKHAPVNLVYVADYGKITDPSAEAKAFYSAADTGFIAQNVYLYCASSGLGCVVRGYLDRDKMAKEMKLSKNQKVVLAQSVGFPK